MECGKGSYKYSERHPKTRIRGHGQDERHQSIIYANKKTSVQLLQGKGASLGIHDSSRWVWHPTASGPRDRSLVGVRGVVCCLALGCSRHLDVGGGPCTKSEFGLFWFVASGCDFGYMIKTRPAGLQVPKTGR